MVPSPTPSYLCLVGEEGPPEGGGGVGVRERNKDEARSFIGDKGWNRPEWRPGDAETQRGW